MIHFWLTSKKPREVCQDRSLLLSSPAVSWPAHLHVQRKRGEMTQRLAWNRGVVMASSVGHRMLIGRYDCLYGLPLFHAKRCLISPPFLGTTSGFPLEIPCGTMRKKRKQSFRFGYIKRPRVKTKRATINYCFETRTKNDGAPPLDFHFEYDICQT